jgi:hypothetical protein
MKNIVSVSSVLAVLALAILPVRATVYTDATGDNYGGAEVDISGVVVTNDANNLFFTINLNTAATISSSVNYLVGIQVTGAPTGQTTINNVTSGATAGNPWGKRVGISTGENFFIGCYPDGNGYSGGAQLYQFTPGTGWAQVGSTASITEVASSTPSITFSFPLSALGLSADNSFKFDVWTTYSSPAGQGAYDALDSSVQASSPPYSPTFANYDSVTATGSTLATYTVVNAAASEAQVTFEVNMTAAMVQGLFSQGAGDYVEARGSFNGWLTGTHTGILLTNVPGTSNYVGTLVTNSLPLGSGVDYKYVIDSGAVGNDWEGNVGVNGAPNRHFTLTNLNQTLPLDYWNNITNPYQSFAVTFQVNMVVQDALGNFTPGTDTLYVNGTWDWSGSAVQLTQTANPEVYTGSVSLSFSPGTTISYKYAMNGGIPVNSWEGNVGPNGGANRQFVLNADTNLPTDFFNNVTNLGPITITNVPEGQALAWTGGARIRLQSATNLLTGWSDVANTEGLSSVTNSPGSAPVMFFRLFGP